MAETRPYSTLYRRAHVARAASSTKYSHRRRKIPKLWCVYLHGAGKVAWLRGNSKQFQMDFRNVCAINAHSRDLLFSDFVVERSPADTEDAGGQFLIAADVREGHANKFVLDAMEGRSYLK